MLVDGLPVDGDELCDRPLPDRRLVARSAHDRRRSSIHSAFPAATLVSSVDRRQPPDRPPPDRPPPLRPMDPERPACPGVAGERTLRLGVAMVLRAWTVLTNVGRAWTVTWGARLIR